MPGPIAGGVASACGAGILGGSSVPNGPPFLFPRTVRSLLCTPSFSNGSANESLNGGHYQLHPVRVHIHASIPRGLRYESARWLAYRRNYLVISAAVSFDLPLGALPLPSPSGLASGLSPLKSSIDNHNFLVDMSTNGSKSDIRRVKFFALTVVAEDEVTGRPVELVQHTSKRDLGPRRKPVVARIRPTVSDSRTPGGTTSTHNFGANVASTPTTTFQNDSYYTTASAKSSSSSNNQLDMEDVHSGIFGEFCSSGLAGNSISSVSDEDEQTVATSVCFERIQFKRATANNGRKNTAQQMFRVVVVLYAAVDDNEDGCDKVKYVEVQRVATVGIMVRGRSPGHYAYRGSGASGANGLIQ
ncbi:hypothetical protein V1511DRAFT_460401 [Dipodascopsis uninucleata]